MGRIGEYVNFDNFKPDVLSQFDPYPYNPADPLGSASIISSLILTNERKSPIEMRQELTGEGAINLLLFELGTGDQTKAYWLIEEREDLRAANPVRWTIALELALSKKYSGIARHMMEKQGFSEEVILQVIRLGKEGRLQAVNAVVNPPQPQIERQETLHELNAVVNPPPSQGFCTIL